MTSCIESPKRLLGDWVGLLVHPGWWWVSITMVPAGLFQLQKLRDPERLCHCQGRFLTSSPPRAPWQQTPFPEAIWAPPELAASWRQRRKFLAVIAWVKSAPGFRKNCAESESPVWALGVKESLGGGGRPKIHSVSTEVRAQRPSGHLQGPPLPDQPRV